MSLKKNAFYSILLNVSNVLFPFITTPYISRILGVENVGVVNFVMAYATYFVMFAMLGVSTYGMREIAKYGEGTNEKLRNKKFIELFSIISISSLLTSIVYIGSIFLVPMLYVQKEFLLVAGLMVYLASFNIEWYLSGREKFQMITIRSILVKLFMIVGMFVFVRTRDDVMPYMVLMVASMLLNHIWNWFYLLRHDFKRVNWKDLQLKYHIKPLLILFSATLAISIYTMLDTLMLGFMSSYAEVGYYTSAMKISRVAMPLVTAMSPVIFARVSILKEQGDFNQIRSVLQNSFLYMYTLAIPLTIGLIVIAPKFVPFFFGIDFMPTIVPLQLLSLLVLIIGMSNVYGSQLVQAMGYDRQFLWVVLIGTIINFGLNMILIFPLGAIGASVASIISELTVLIAMVVFSRKILKLKFEFKAISQPVIASLPILIVGLLLYWIGVETLEYLVIVITLSILFYVGIMYFVFKNETVSVVVQSMICKIRSNKIMS